MKTIEDYYTPFRRKSITYFFRGHVLTEEDLIIRRHILNLMCQFSTSWNDKTLYFNELPKVLDSLEEMKEDGLVNIQENTISVTEKETICT